MTSQGPDDDDPARHGAAPRRPDDAGEPGPAGRRPPRDSGGPRRGGRRRAARRDGRPAGPGRAVGARRRGAGRCPRARCPTRPAGGGSCTPSCGTGSTPTSARATARHCTGGRPRPGRTPSAWTTRLPGVVAGHWLRAAADARHAAAGGVVGAPRVGRRHPLPGVRRGRPVPRDGARRRVRAGCTDEERAVLLVDLATAEFRAGRFAESLRHAVAASDAAAACGRADLLADAALVVHDVGAPGFAATLTRLCERALAEPEVGRSPALRSRLLSQAASALADAGRHGRATELSTESLASRRAGRRPRDRHRRRPRPHEDEPGCAAARGADAARPAGGRARRAATGQPLIALWGHKWRIDAALEVGDMATVEDELALRRRARGGHPAAARPLARPAPAGVRARPSTAGSPRPWT